MKKIDTEAHFYIREYQDYLFSRKETPREELYKGYVRLWYEPNIWEPHGREIEDSLLDLSEGRLRKMDIAGCIWKGGYRKTMMKNSIISDNRLW